MFAALRASLAPGGGDGRAQNLIECKDDMLFAWNANECSVLCLNWRAAYTRESDGGGVGYQVSAFVVMGHNLNVAVSVTGCVFEYATIFMFFKFV